MKIMNSEQRDIEDIKTILTILINSIGYKNLSSIELEKVMKIVDEWKDESN